MKKEQGPETSGMESRTEIEVKPFFTKLPTYLEATHALKKRGFKIDSITFTPDDNGVGSDVKIAGEDASVVVDLAEYVSEVAMPFKYKGEKPTKEEERDFISKTASMLANARAGRKIYEV